MYFIHKYQVSQQYGGPEEGGWWYDAGEPVEDWFPLILMNEEQAYLVCRALNAAETDRRESDEDYEYTSVLSGRSTFYDYAVDEDPIARPFPATRPHYE
jgi:hypothetical protein